MSYSDRSPVGNAPDWLENLNRLIIQILPYHNTLTVQLYKYTYYSYSTADVQYIYICCTVHTIQSTGQAAPVSSTVAALLWVGIAVAAVPPVATARDLAAA